jgi:hypothetical protein
MKRRRQALFAAAAVLLLLILYVFGPRGPAGRAEQSGKRPLVPALESAELQELRLSFPGGQSAGEAGGNGEPGQAAGGGAEFHFVLHKGEWRVSAAGPGLPELPARTEAVRHMMKELRRMEIAGRVTQGREHWSELGVQPAEAVNLTLRFNDGSGVSELQLFFGKGLSGSDRCYVRRGGEAAVFSVPAPELLQRRELSDWAYMRLFPGVPQPAKTISLTLESFRGDEIRIYRSSGTGVQEERWVLETGKGRETAVIEEGRRVDELLRHFYALKAVDIRRGCGESRQAILSITAESEESTTYALELFPLPEGGRGYLACRRGDGRRHEKRAYVLEERPIAVLRGSLERVLENVSRR